MILMELGLKFCELDCHFKLYNFIEADLISNVEKLGFLMFHCVLLKECLIGEHL